MSRRKPRTTPGNGTTRNIARGDSQSPAAIAVAVLIGAGFSLLACGYVLEFQITLDVSPITYRLATAALFAATALGPRLPRWLALRAMGVSRRWWARAPEAGLGVPSQRVDRDIWWTIVSIVGLLAGVAALILPVVLGAAHALHGQILRRFLWTGNSLLVLDTLIMGLAALPFVAVGLFAQCAHRRSGDTRRWNPAMLAWMSGGAAFGLMAASLLGISGARAAVLLRGGAALILLAAIIVVWRAGSGNRATSAQPSEAPLREPETGQQWPVILRLTIAVAVVATISSGLIWVYVVDALDMTADGRGPLVGGGLLAFAAVGLWHAVRGHDHAAYGVGAFGIRCALAGVMLAAGVAAFNLVARASYAGFINGPGIWLLWGLCAGVPLAIAGRAIGFGVCEVLARCGHDSDTGAGALQMLFGSASVAFLGVALVLLEYLGSYAALVALALALLATGGTLVIHQPCPKRRVHHLRLAAVFGGVAGMTFLMPSAGRHWLGHQQRVRGQMWESWWVTHDMRLPRDAARVSADATMIQRVDQLIDWYRVPAGCRVGVISLFGNEHIDLPEAIAPRVEQWALLADGGRSENGLGAGSRSGHLSAMRAMRASSERFDVLIVSLGTAPVEFASFILRDGFVRRAWSRLAPDGVQVYVLPADPGLLAALRERVVAGTPADAPPAVAWIDVVIGGRPSIAAFATLRRDGALPLIAQTGADSIVHSVPIENVGNRHPDTAGAIAAGR